MSLIAESTPESELRAAWLARRRQGIGGSDAAAVIGENPWRSPLQVYCDKLGIADETEDNEAMEWGRRLEPVVAAKYAEETGRTLVDPGRFTIAQSPSCPFMFATLDRVIDRDPRGPGLLEVKTTGDSHEEEWAEGVPRLPWIQVQHQLAVTGYTWGSVAVLIGGKKFRWVDVERSDEFITALIEEERKFWGRIESLDPPAPDGSWATSEAIKKLYPRDTGATIALPGDLIDHDLELLQIKEDLKRLGLRKDEIENRIKALIGEASVGVLPNGVKFTWKAQTRAEYVVPESTFRVLRRSTK